MEFCEVKDEEFWIEMTVTDSEKFRDPTVMEDN